MLLPALPVPLRAVALGAFTLATAAALAAAAPAGPLLVPQQFGTIQAAVDAAQPGDVITVSPGVYFENVVIPFGDDGLVLQGKGPATVLDGRAIDAAGSGDALVVDGCDNVVIRNLTVRNATAGGTGAFSYGFGIDASGDGIVIDRVTVLRAASGGVLVEGDDAVVSNCTVGGCDGGIEVDGDGALITKCTVSGDTTAGLGISGSGGTISKSHVTCISDSGIWVEGDDDVVAGNVVFNGGDVPLSCTGNNPAFTKNTVEGGNDEQNGLFIQTCAGGLVSGNKFVNVAALAVGLALDTSGITIDKNQFTGGGLGFPLVVLGGDGHVFTGNSITGCGGDAVLAYGAGDTVGGNKIQRALGTGLYVVGSADGTIVQGNSISDCTWQGLRNSGLNTHALDNAFKGNRLDVTNDGSLAEFTGNVFATGGPGVAPEP